MRTQKTFSWLFISMCFAVMIGCGGGGTDNGSTSTTGTGTPPPPSPSVVVSSFVAEPATINAGASSTLRWTVSGATTITIDQGIGAVSGTSRTVTPTTTTIYLLTATNGSSSVTRSVTVTVNGTPPPPPPVVTITSFAAEPATINAGGTATLRWAVSGATTLSIDQGIGVVTGTTRTVTPTTTTTYLLSAINGATTVTRSVTVTVNTAPPPPPPPPPPASVVISSFAAEPSAINAGGSATLRWAVTGATTLSIDQGIGVVTGTSRTVTPTATTTYLLTAGNGTTSVTRSVTVTVNGSQGALKPLMAPARVTGSMTVKLHPVEGVPTGEAQLVTFGVPFTRGSVTQADLSKLRVLRTDGTEIPAYVDQLTPWRHALTPTLDGTSVRVARVQIRYSFTAQYPNSESVTISWGTTARSQNVTTLTDPRTGWRPVTTGSFVAADGVSEPNVYAVLPTSALIAGVLKIGPMNPFDSNVAETRDDPNVMDATEHYPAFSEQDYASKNFFYSNVNQDDSRVTATNLNPYKTDAEPWLYDRVTAFYVLYMRSGFFKALRESVRAAEFYRIQLYPQGTTPDGAVGVFKLKAPSPSAYIGANGVMYTYPEGLAYTHWLTGDELAKTAAKAAVKAHEDITDEQERYSTGTGYTERHMSFRVIANVVGYELFGDQPYKTGSTKTYRERMLTLTENLIWHQNGAGGILPTNRVDGGLWKYGRQEGNGPADQFTVSFWQTPFIIEAMLRAYVMTDSADIGNFIRRSGTAMKAATKSYAPADRDVYDNVPENLRLVDYATVIDGSQYTPDGAFSQHALQLSAGLCWSHYFSRLMNQPDPTLKQWAQDLYRTYDYEANEWTRPAAPASGLTAYRNAPPRMYNWQYKPSGSLSWCMTD